MKNYFKNFISESDYLAFIESSEADFPNVSSVSTGETADYTHYNPVKLLLVNSKKIISPSSNIIAIVDSTQNGNVGAWYKKGNESTYSKASSNDKNFNSGDTIGRTDVTFVKSELVTDILTTGYNTSIIISGTSENGSVIDSSETIQYGYIGLTPGMLTNIPNTGGTFSLEVNIPQGNEWKLVCNSSWLHFSVTSGIGAGVQTISVTADTNSENERVVAVTFSYTKFDDYSESFTARQNGGGYNFSWNQSTYNVNSGNTSTVAAFSTNYNVNDLTFTYNGMITFTGNLTTTSITVNYGANPNTSGRTGTITAKYGDVVLGSCTVNQAAMAYFNWSVTSTTVNSGETSTGISYTTNYSNISFTYDGMITGVTTGSSSVTAKFIANPDASERTGHLIASKDGNSWSTTINQTPKAYFNWTNSPVSVSSGITTATLTYSSNYTSRTFTYSGIITSVTDNNNGTVTVTFPANSSTSTSTGTVTAFGQTATVNQAAMAYFNWVDTSVNVSSGAGSTVLRYSSNYTTRTFTNSGIITGVTDNNDGTVTVTYPANSSTSTSTGSVTAFNKSATVNQAAKAYFNWTSTPGQVGSGATNTAVTYSTNYTGLTFTGDGTVITSVTTSNGSVTAYFNENPSESVRTGYVYARVNSTEISNIGINQAGKIVYYFKFVSSNSSAYTQTVGSGSTSQSVSIDTNYPLSSISVSGNSNLTGYTYDTVSSFTGKYNSNSVGESSSPKTIEVSFNVGSTKVGLLTLNQTIGPWIKFDSPRANYYGNSAASNVSHRYTTNMTQATLNTLSARSGADWLTIRSFDKTTGSGYVYFNIAQNTAITPSTRNTDIDIVSGSYITWITVYQSAATPYFTWNPSEKTVNANVTSAVMQYSTNYPSITFTTSGIVNSVSTASTSVTASFGENPLIVSREGWIIAKYGSTVVGTCKITQNAASAYFRWEEGQPKTISSGSSSVTVTYSTNIPNLSYSYDGTVVTGHTGGSTSGTSKTLTAKYTVNPSTSARTTGSITAKSGSTTLGTFTFTQAAAPYFSWSGTTIVGTGSIRVSASSTSVVIPYYTNFETVKFVSSGSLITSIVSGSNSITVSYNANTSSANTRDGYVRVRTGSSVSTYAWIKIEQDVKPYFNWVSSQPMTISSGASSVTVTYTTNITNLSFAKDGTVITGTTGTSSGTNVTVKVGYSANPSTSARTTGSITAKDGNTSVSGFTFTQNAKAYFNWNTTGTSVGSASTSTSVGYTTNITGLSFSTSGMVTGVTTGSSSITAKFIANPNTSERSGWIIATKDGTSWSTKITQAAMVYFTWVSSNPMTIGSGASSVNLTYSTNVASLSFAGDGTVVTGTTGTSSGTNVTVKVGYTANPNTTGRGSGSVIAKNGSTQIGNAFGFTQAGKAYFEWTSTPSTVGSGATTGVTASYSTNYTGLTFTPDGSVITGATGNNGTLTMNFSANTTTAPRTGSVVVKANGGTSTINSLSITQLAKAYFNFNPVSTSVSYNTTSARTTYTTNISGISFASSGMVISTSTGSSSSVTANFSTNPSTSARTGWVLAKSGSITVSAFTITQSASAMRNCTIHISGSTVQIVNNLNGYVYINDLVADTTPNYIDNVFDEEIEISPLRTKTVSNVDGTGSGGILPTTTTITVELTVRCSGTIPSTCTLVTSNGTLSNTFDGDVCVLPVISIPITAGTSAITVALGISKITFE